MIYRPDRRTVLTGMLATPAALASTGAFGQVVAPIVGDVPLGDPEAAVTVIEYASFTCPHCAAFHIDTWPKFKEAYVDSGKVRFIMREVYFDQYGLWASMVARCGGERGFYPLVDAFLKQQSTWSRSSDIGAEIQKIGRRAGLGNDQLAACLSDQQLAKDLVEAYQANAEADGIRSTPSFMINGELHSGNMSFEKLSELVDAAM